MATTGTRTDSLRDLITVGRWLAPPNGFQPTTHCQVQRGCDACAMEFALRWGRRIMWTDLGLNIAVAIGATLAGGGPAWNLAALVAFSIGISGAFMRDRVRRHIPTRPDVSR